MYNVESPYVIITNDADRRAQNKSFVDRFILFYFIFKYTTISHKNYLY